ncbi:RidA family protein [Rossellomorea sp. NS-SX7]|uniref:RidA family protein n=1 Tax=Rossellomorea sp. NS-SX7 TaxID=3463856 RepID=UPI004059E357
MSDKLSFIRSTNLASVDYAYASRVPSDMDMLFLAGACPLDKDGNVAHPGNYENQAKWCVENMKEVLRECGASLKDVVYTRVLVASQDRSDLVTAWRAIREEFGEHDVPSTLSGVTVLGYENQLVEIEAVAAVEKGSK